MLDLGRYLLGVAEIGLLVGFAWLGASTVRSRLLPDFSGAPAHLASAVLALALLLWVAELLGTVGLFEAAPYVLAVALVGAGLWTHSRGWRRGGVDSPDPKAAEGKVSTPSSELSRRPEQRGGPPRVPRPDDRTRGRALDVATLIALAIAAIAVVKFGLEMKPKLSTGMTGFDSTWYHGPFAAGFFQGGDTWSLHFIAPQFLAWFYPANSEVFHAVGMLAFDRDVLSPLLNLGWFVGCLVAAWCIGRPYEVAPVSLALGAIALSLPALSDQAGEARNDIVGIFFLLAAVAIAVNAWASRSDGDRLPLGAIAVVGLSAGLAAGTKLNFLLPAAVLIIGLVAIAPRGGRWRALTTGGLAALAGGGYWYLRNLANSGNPLPWFDQIGPISLPAPDQALGGREAHSVLGYLTDGTVWSDWFLPGLHDGLSFFWPLIGVLALAGLVLCLGRSASPLLRVAGLTGLAVVLAWLIAPTSASGPDGMPRGFESGLRYLAPALVLGLALLPGAPLLRKRLASIVGVSSPFFADKAKKGEVSRRVGGRTVLVVAGGLVVLAVCVGYPVQRHYLEDRYESPTFTTPGLNAAFAWSRDISDARIATTSTRQYPLFGTDLSNHVQFVGTERPHGGFTAPTSCRAWRTLLNAGDYDYVIATRDRIEPNKSAYPPTVAWTVGPRAKVILSTPPTAVLKLRTPLDPSGCR